MSSMRVLSINVGLPRAVEWRGQVVETSIFKSPVAGPVQVNRLNVDGDRQADLTAHGGAEKAVYAYPSEHYPLWRKELLDTEFEYAAFGENFTTSGLTEANLHVGDRLRAGSAEFVATQPRTPCFKLGLRFNRLDMGKRLIGSGRTGFYLAVVREGTVAPGDEISIIEPDPDAITIAEIVSLYRSGGGDQSSLRRVSQLAALPEGWRSYFSNRLHEPSGPDEVAE